MIPMTSKTIVDITEPVPPAEPTDYNTMTFNKPTLIQYVEYGLNEMKEKHPIEVIDIQIGAQTIVTYREKVK